MSRNPYAIKRGDSFDGFTCGKPYNLSVTYRAEAHAGDVKLWWIERESEGPDACYSEEVALALRWAARDACRRLRAQRDQARHERDEIAIQACADLDAANAELQELKKRCAVLLDPTAPTQLWTPEEGR